MSFTSLLLAKHFNKDKVKMGISYQISTDDFRVHETWVAVGESTVHQIQCEPNWQVSVH